MCLSSLVRLFCHLCQMKSSAMHLNSPVSFVYIASSFSCVVLPLHSRLMSTAVAHTVYPKILRSSDGSYDLAQRYLANTSSTSPSPITGHGNSQNQSSWGTETISTVIFGCLASILGVLTIWATLSNRKKHCEDNGRTSILFRHLIIDLRILCLTLIGNELGGFDTSSQVDDTSEASDTTLEVPEDRHGEIRAPPAAYFPVESVAQETGP